jgi:hypothetical protein
MCQMVFIHHSSFTITHQRFLRVARSSKDAEQTRKGPELHKWMVTSTFRIVFHSETRGQSKSTYVLESMIEDEGFATGELEGLAVKMVRQEKKRGTAGRRKFQEILTIGAEYMPRRYAWCSRKILLRDPRFNLNSDERPWALRYDEDVQSMDLQTQPVRRNLCLSQQS